MTYLPGGGDVAVTVAEFDGGQAVSEGFGVVELGVDGDFAGGVGVAPFAEFNEGEAGGEIAGAFELGID